MSDDSTFTGADFAPSADGGSSAPAEGVTVSATPDPTAQPGAATTEPAVGQDPNRSTEGPIPFAVHKTALENARTKASQEALGGLTTEQLREVRQWFDRARQDTDGFLEETFLEHANPMALLERLVAKVQQHPKHGENYRSFVGRKLAEQRGAVEPPADLQYEMPDGKLVTMYSAQQQAKREAWLQQRWMSDARKEMEPALTAAQQLKTEREAQAAQAADHQWMSTTLTDAMTWPGMDDKAFREAVSNRVAADIGPRDVTNHDIERAIDRAYRAEYHATFSTRERSKVLHDINRTAAAATVNPARTGTQAPRDYRDKEVSIADALRMVSEAT